MLIFLKHWPEDVETWTMDALVLWSFKRIYGKNTSQLQLMGGDIVSLQWNKSSIKEMRIFKSKYVSPRYMINPRLHGTIHPMPMELLALLTNKQTKWRELWMIQEFKLASKVTKPKELHWSNIWRQSRIGRRLWDRSEDIASTFSQARYLHNHHTQKLSQHWGPTLPDKLGLSEMRSHPLTYWWLRIIDYVWIFKIVLSINYHPFLLIKVLNTP